jgi:two-component system nitrogen regulation sensor histidine kinase NtrY
MESDSVLPRPPALGLGRGRIEKLNLRPLVGVGFAVSGVLAALAVGLGSSPSLSGPLGPASPLVMALLWINLGLLVVLGGLVGARLVRLMAEQSSDAGARLHLRFVALFAAAAALPALIVALFFGVLVTRGVEAWFNTRVQTVVENSAKVARSYLEEQGDYIRDHAFLIARDLNSAGPSQLANSPVAFSQFLAQQAADNGFSAAYVIDRKGRALANARVSAAPDFLVPSD